MGLTEVTPNHHLPIRAGA